MGLNRIYRILIMLAILSMTASAYYQGETYVQTGVQLFPPPANINPAIPDGSMEIDIRPAGTFELKDPLGRRIVHCLNKKDIIEIPNAYYDEERFSQEDPYTGRIYIESPVGGGYELKILHVVDERYIFCVSAGNEKGDQHDKVTLIDIPFKKGQPHIYDIQFDKKNWKVKVIRK